MIFVYTLFMFLALLRNVKGVEGPSFRSNWNDGGKPILRGGGPLNENDTGNDDTAKTNWLDMLRSGISSLVKQYGYDTAKPHIEKLVDETEKNNNVLLHVEVNRDGQSLVDYKQYLRSPSPDPVWPPTQPPPPQWLVDLKAFIKNLVERYGQVSLDEHLRPVIKYVQKLNNVYIKDIDVDEFGKILMLLN